jgi:ELWxxDGT repeat protein
MKLRNGLKNLGLLVFCMMSWFTMFSAEAVVKTVPMEEGRLCSDIVEFQGAAYFCYENHQYGAELHRSDGSRYGSKIVIDIDKSGFPLLRGLFVFQDKLFFIARSSNEGWLLWKTDGTQGGTQLVKTIANQNEFLNYAKLTKVGQIRDTLFFQFGGHLYRTNGSAAGTARITSVEEGLTSFKVHGNYLYFMSFWDPVLRKVDSDGNLLLVKSFNAYSASLHEDSVDMRMMIKVQGFTPDPTDLPSKTIDEYWLSDGTTNGTDMALRRSHIQPLRVVNGKLLYLDIINHFDKKLMSTQNWSSSSLVANIDIPHGASIESRKVGDNVFFTVGNDALYVTDGTDLGTKRTTIHSTDNAELNGNLIGGDRSDTSIFSSKLRIIDGVDKLISDLYDFGRELVLRNFVSAGANTYFSFYDDGVYSQWVTSGTTSSTKLVRDHLGRIEPQGTLGNGLFYVATAVENDIHKNYLWYSNGTPEGTHILKYSYDDGEKRQVGDALFLPAIITLILDD